MTAPDPRPYAAPTDLVTAADVASELRRLIQAGRTYTYEAADAIDDRLDRERRQACRRGALACWRDAVDGLAIARSWEAERAEDWTPEELGYGFICDALSRALAFRAAARQP